MEVIDVVFSTSIKYILCFILVIIFIYLFRLDKLDKRIKQYTIDSSKEKISLFDKIHNAILKTINDISDTLKINNKFNINKYKKYMPIFNEIDDEYDIITIKLFISIVITFIILITNFINMDTIRIYQIILIILSYYIFDLYIYIKYKLYIKKIENELLNAIMIMNNAFKSGKSIIGAVESVMNETNGILTKEFTTMYKELTFGLDINIVFKRFSDRIDIEELKYLASALTVISKTGGNIVRVFELIQNNLINKKRIKLELNSSTTGSKLIFYVVTILPILLGLTINTLDKDYFKALYTTSLGYAILLLIFVIYILYIFTIRKIMKVDGVYDI